MAISRNSVVVALLLAGSFITTAAAKTAAPKPEKVPVVFGAWTGRGAGTFKSGVRPIVAKACLVTTKKKARALIEGEVVPKDKGVVLRLSIKGAQNGEVVESREFVSPKPSPSRGLINKIGRAIADMVRLVPLDQAPPQ